MAVTAAGGASVLWGTYGEFLNSTQGLGLGTQYTLMAIGLSLTLNGSAGAFRRASLALFALWALIALSLGLRGEVLFAGAVGLATLARHVRLPRGPKLLALYAGALAVVALIKQYRSVGATGVDALRDMNPFDALTELGSTLRVLATVVVWQHNGEPPRNGETYFVALSRLKEGLLAPGLRPPAQADYRLFNVEIGDRAGQIGGSIAAEAYHNFGLGGVVIVMLLCGMLMGQLDAFGVNRARIALAAVIAAPLFVHIRNSFVPVIPAIALGVALLIACYFLGQVIERRQGIHSHE
ncbi:O-antigen polysaccharide polymerase Wzy [Ornithinimicrobium sp. LYQ121]|uniref:O-antigen polysaccharide polymerase Wzy n=1 Tax=Ornithinimicrobium sp. LYQ121 TaxID=3378801 RepID=UPI0038524EAD